MKRLLQYTSHKNNHASFRPLTPRSRAHFTSAHLLPHLSLFSTYFLRASCYACSFLTSRLCFCFSAWAFLSCLVSCHTCIFYMHALHPASTTVHASLLYLYSSSRASWLHALTSYHTLHFILYLYSVLLGRASSAVVLQRLPNIRCLSCLLCTCSTSSRTGYESESPTNSGVIEDTGNSTCAVYCVGYEEGRGGIQKCCVCWKG